MLDIDDARDFVYNDVFSRGENYYRKGAVEKAVFRGENELVAYIQGTYPYQTVIKLHDQMVFSGCSCPYGGLCKHTIALLLYAMRDFDKIDQGALVDEGNIKKYLASLPRKKLEDLVIEYAPASFKEYINNISLPSEKTKPKLDQCIEKIYRLFEDVEFLYEPGDFEAALLKQLEKIEGIWEQHPVEGKKLVLDIMRKVDVAIDEGYLYNSYYDDVLDTSAITKYFHRFIKTLDIQQKILFMAEVENVLLKSSYDTFGDLSYSLEHIFEPSELQDLKNHYLQSLDKGNLTNAENYAEFLAKEFSSEERYGVLEKIHHLSQWLTLQYANECHQRGHIHKGITALKNCLDLHSYGNQSLYEKLLEFKKELHQDTTGIALEALKNEPSESMMRIALQYAPNKRDDLEGILKIENPSTFLDYLEAQQRIGEAFVFLDHKSIGEERKFTFFRKHKNFFAEASEEYFTKRIEQNLDYTGDRYYLAIADTLKELKKVNTRAAESMLSQIRSEYKRRRNLISLLSEL